MPHSASSVSAGFDHAGSLNQPGSGRPSLAQDRVDRPGPGVEQEDERQGAGHRRSEVRRVEERAQQPGTVLDPDDEHADGHAEDHPQGDHHHDEPDRVAQGRPEERVVLEHEAPVLQAVEGRRAEPVVVREREVDRREQRVEEEQPGAEQPGRQEREVAQRLPATPAPRRVRAGLGTARRSGGGRAHGGSPLLALCLLALVDVGVDLLRRLAQRRPARRPACPTRRRSRRPAA